MADNVEMIRRLTQLMLESFRDDHIHALGLKFLSIDKGYASMELPFSKNLVGNPCAGTVHGGALTALLDSCCGIAASTMLDEPGLSPTLDLRIDHTGGAKPGMTIYADARVYHSSRSVIFCRGKAYQDDPEKPIAHCVANFARLDPEVQRAFADQIKPFLEGLAV
jgi:uncharacterized protein (TIGR00369 family)